MSRDHVISKLKEIRDGLPEIRKKGVMFRRTAEFRIWNDTVIKWLSLGLPNTQEELKKVKFLDFAVSRVRMGSEDYDYEDQQEYEKDCEHTIYLISSAIENLEMGLVPGEPKAAETPRRERAPSKYGGVSIAQAGTVVMGDSNVVSIVDSITISDFLNVLEKEIEAKVVDAEQRKSLLQKVKELSQNPTFTTVLGQTLGQVLRAAFGQ